MILQRLARIKSRATRLNPYVQLVQVVMLVSIGGWKDWYWLIPIPAVIIYWYEKTYGIAGEMDISWQASATWKTYLKEFEELKKKVYEDR